MPLNVRRFYSSVLLVLFGFLISQAQTVAPQPSPVPQVQPTTNTGPTSGDVMRERITKAKAFIAVRNYNAAIYELENIRRESADAAVQSVTSVLLMNSYLELGDYRRAQEFLNQLYAQQKTTKPNAMANYAAVAGQVVKGARMRAERYRALGLNIADRTLPLEALNDLERMRETLELVIKHSKEISQTPAKSADAIALLEEATSSRSMLARDDYDARFWKEQVADLREQVATNGKVVLSAVTETPTNTSSEFVATNGVPPPVETKPIQPNNNEQKPEQKVADSTVSKVDTPVVEPAAPVKENPTTVSETPKNETASTAKNDSPIDAGSLLQYATKQTAPVYPSAARAIRSTGIVRLDVTVDENGNVTEVQKATGPPMLQAAAKDAIRKWKFKPFVRDGQPVKAVGYVSFNFSL